MTTPRSRTEPTTPTVDDKTVLVPYEQVDCVIVIGLFKEPIIGSLKSMMAEIRHLEIDMTSFFFCRGWSDLDKISDTGAEWHVDCGDVVEIKTRFRIPIWRTFWRIQWHVIPEPRITLQGAATCDVGAYTVVSCGNCQSTLKLHISLTILYKAV